MGLNFRVDSIRNFDDVKQALQKVKEALDASVLEKGEWVFFEITLAKAVTAFKYSHKLKFTPKDVIQVSVTGGVTVTWDYDNFDSTYLLLSTTGACTVRAYIGKHLEGSDA